VEEFRRRSLRQSECRLKRRTLWSREVVELANKRLQELVKASKGQHIAVSTDARGTT